MANHPNRRAPSFKVMEASISADEADAVLTVRIHCAPWVRLAPIEHVRPVIESALNAAYRFWSDYR